MVAWGWCDVVCSMVFLVLIGLMTLELLFIMVAWLNVGAFHRYYFRARVKCRFYKINPLSVVSFAICIL